MVDTRIYVARQNLRRYRELLENYLDGRARDVIEQLIKETEAELEAAEAEKQSAEGAPLEESASRVRRWRLKAEEYRATAEITQSDLARQTYLRLAQDYERLADAIEAQKTQTQKSQSK